MSGPPTGLYRIILDGVLEPPALPVGVNNSGSAVEPVVTAGESAVWFVQKLENGRYHLYLDQGGTKKISFGEGEKVFVGDVRLTVEWAIKRKEPDYIYSIEVPGDLRPTCAWTLDSTIFGTEVKLDTCEIPRDEQLWVFRPILKL